MGPPPGRGGPPQRVGRRGRTTSTETLRDRLNVASSHHPVRFAGPLRDHGLSWNPRRPGTVGVRPPSKRPHEVFYWVTILSLEKTRSAPRSAGTSWGRSSGPPLGFEAGGGALGLAGLLALARGAQLLHAGPEERVDLLGRVRSPERRPLGADPRRTKTDQKSPAPKVFLGGPRHLEPQSPSVRSVHRGVASSAGKIGRFRRPARETRVVRIGLAPVALRPRWPDPLFEVEAPFLSLAYPGSLKPFPVFLDPQRSVGSGV